MVLDSDSDDQTVALARKAGFAVRVLPRREFNHGGTRQLAAEILADLDIVVYMTQDAVVASPDSIERLLAAFADPSVGAAFGRQLPRHHATPIEAHARLFNYGGQSRTMTLASRNELGIKTVFLSNSFAAYRRSALMEVGGFPVDAIFGEDTITAAKLLLAGWSTAYVAEATVYHSHDYTWRQEFRRYFDIGVLHAREPWLLDEFGRTSGEGKRFVRSELSHLWPGDARFIPSALIRTFLKLAGYRLGRIESSLDPALKRKLSMHPAFWHEADPEKLKKLKTVQ
jgi:rhamnosyltransferase